MESLNLRVFRRTSDSIALLFNKLALTEAQLATISVAAVNRGNTKDGLLFSISDGKDDNGTAPEHALFLLISHAVNKLESSEDYLLTITFGTGDASVSSSILVYAAGILPMFERDDRRINQHVYGWSDEERRWVKLPVVKCKNGQYAVPVTLIKD